jgi:hypothetical protein
MTDDQTADLLTRTLDEVAQQTDYPTTPVLDVRRRARAAQSRRRRTAGLAAAAAVVLVVTPTAVWLSRSPGTSPSPSHELTSSPSVPTSPWPRLEALPRGPKPGIDYLIGDTYVEMGGGHLTSPSFARASSVALRQGGVLVATPHRGPVADLSIVTDGHVTSLGCGSSRFAITADRVETAYWHADSCASQPSGGRVVVGPNNSMGGRPGSVRFDNSGPVQPIGFVRQGVVVNARPATGPEVLVVQGTAISTLVTAAGTDVNNDVISGQLALTRDRFGVVDASDGRVLWTAPSGWALGQFSVDGRYVLGFGPQPGAKFSPVAVFDARTGATVTTMDPQAGPGQIAWDQNDTLLAVVGGGRQAIVRFDLQGHETRATPIRRVSSKQSGYRLATRP